MGLGPGYSIQLRNEIDSSHIPDVGSRQRWRYDWPATHPYVVIAAEPRRMRASGTVKAGNMPRVRPGTQMDGGVYFLGDGVDK